MPSVRGKELRSEFWVHENYASDRNLVFAPILKHYGNSPASIGGYRRITEAKVFDVEASHRIEPITAGRPNTHRHRPILPSGFRNGETGEDDESSTFDLERVLDGEQFDVHAWRYAPSGPELRYSAGRCRARSMLSCSTRPISSTPSRATRQRRKCLGRRTRPFTTRCRLNAR